MKRSDYRILTTHTGSLPQQKVARRLRGRIAGLFAGEIRHFVDIRLRIGDERDFTDMAA
jgi:hypothetical protein